MTKKDYELIAGAIKNCHRYEPVGDGMGDADDMMEYFSIKLPSILADQLAAQNPKFNRARFLLACGVEMPNSTPLEPRTTYTVHSGGVRLKGYEPRALYCVWCDHLDEMTQTELDKHREEYHKA